jgi:hypothetical protein
MGKSRESVASGVLTVSMAQRQTLAPRQLLLPLLAHPGHQMLTKQLCLIPLSCTDHGSVSYPIQKGK